MKLEKELTKEEGFDYALNSYKFNSLILNNRACCILGNNYVNEVTRYILNNKVNYLEIDNIVLKYA